MTQQNVIVTAGASGIGRATAMRFRAAGARVAICDVDRAAIERLRNEDPAIEGDVVDVADAAQVHSFVANMQRLFGGIDTLINNAGIAGACAAMERIDAANWRRCFEVNVEGALYMMQAVTPGMKKRRSGSIINISTGSVVTLPVGRADYIASKWALEGLTRAAAKELGASGIRVNAIRPGFVDREGCRRKQFA
jgi:NAD(P)-dependent dehydrogenase (short-subunit alcohol dehydrogenase family)